MRGYLLLLPAFAAASAGCSGSSAGPSAAKVVPDTDATPVATGNAVASGHALRLFITVPNGTTGSLGRGRSYVSRASKAIVFTLDQPQLADETQRHRTDEFDLLPGRNEIDIDSPDGPLELTASTFDRKGGGGHELGYSDPQSITIDANGPPQKLDILLNPVIVEGVAASVGPIKTIQVYFAGDPNGVYTECIGFTGQLFVSGVDGAGETVDGAGRFLDTSHHDVSLSLVGGVVGGPSAPNGFAQSGLVSATGGPYTQASGGAFAQTGPIGLTAATSGAFPAIQVTASSPLVATFTSLAGNPQDVPLCFTVTGG